jgi:magnesium transporter
MVADPAARIWVDLVDPPFEVIAAVANDLGLHPLIVEDIDEKNQRAKIVEFDDVIHVVVFDLDYQGEVHPSEIDLVLGRRFLLSVHQPDRNLAERIAARNGAGACSRKGRTSSSTRSSTTSSTATSRSWIAWPTRSTRSRTRSSSRRRSGRCRSCSSSSGSSWRSAGRRRRPARCSTSRRTATFPVIAPEHIVYFRDVYDHLIRVTDELDNYRDLVAGTLDIYLSTINNNLRGS